MVIKAEALSKDLAVIGQVGETGVFYARLGNPEIFATDPNNAIISDYTFRKVWAYDETNSQATFVIPVEQSINILSLNNPQLMSTRIRVGFPAYNKQVLHMLGIDTGEGMALVGQITPQEQYTANIFYPSVGQITNLRIEPLNPPALSVFVGATPYYKADGTWAIWGGESLDIDAVQTLVDALSGQHQMVLVCLDPATDSTVLITNTASDGGQADKDLFDWTTIATDMTIDPSFITGGTFHIYDGQTEVVEDDIYRTADPRVIFGKPTGGSGTVTSVAESTDASYLTVGGSPITTAGTITLNKTDGLTANQFVATPDGSTGKADLRAIVAGDLTGALVSPPPIGTTTPNTGYFSALWLKIGGFFGIFTHANSADRTYTFPDASGTVALTSDIPAAGITQLTGDVTAGPGSGSQAATLATVNSNVGSFTNTSLTVNAKGLITAASSGTAPVTNVTGTSPIASSGGTTPDISLGVVGSAHLADYWRPPVRVSETSNVNIASAPSTMDSTALTANDRVILVGQTTGSQNGPWIFNGTGNALTRPDDYAAGSTTQALTNIVYYVLAGSARVGSLYRLTTTGTITIDTTSTTWLNLFVVRASDLYIRDGITSTFFAHITSITLTASRTYLLPDVNNDTFVMLDFAQTLTNKTLTTPTIASFTNATHDHTNAAGGGTLSASAIASGQLALNRGGTHADLSAAGAGVLQQATSGADVTIQATTGTGNVVRAGSPTITTPTIADLTNMTHTHQNAAGGGTLDAAAIAAGTLAVARGGTNIGSYAAKGDLLASSGTTTLSKLAVGADGTHLVADSAQTTGLKWQNGYPFAVIEEQQTSGTAGGGSTATTWTIRVLNTEVVDADNLVTISSNKFTPIAGTYLIEVDSPFIGNAATNGCGRIRLYNTTAAAEVIRSVNYPLMINMGANMHLWYGFTANGTDQYEIDYFVSQGRVTNGLGNAISEASNVERFTRVTLIKVGG